MPWIGSNLAEILGVHEERIGANDNTVRYQGLRLQSPQDSHRFHEVTGMVRVHEYPAGTWAVFQGPRCRARDSAEGVLREVASTIRPQHTSRRACR